MRSKNSYVKIRRIALNRLRYDLEEAKRRESRARETTDKLTEEVAFLRHRIYEIETQESRILRELRMQNNNLLLLLGAYSLKNPFSVFCDNKLEVRSLNENKKTP